eukprot:CAMPEP_0114662764 /NCGR_PEP_ID=MMETSP0191-20121206/25515_1 /TAXON_ID=126664 /ORGANISM="Sorites sp." /LENGTH=290 /DNA_ID=CAMNT_0001899995 /DNA_START=72 /DNA_END=944 /DNA_ORIENTATION=-
MGMLQLEPDLSTLVEGSVVTLGLHVILRHERAHVCTTRVSKSFTMTDLPIPEGAVEASILHGIFRRDSEQCWYTKGPAIMVIPQFLSVLNFAAALAVPIDGEAHIMQCSDASLSGNNPMLVLGKTAEFSPRVQRSVVPPCRAGIYSILLLHDRTRQYQEGKFCPTTRRYNLVGCRMRATGGGLARLTTRLGGSHLVARSPSRTLLVDLMLESHWVALDASSLVLSQTPCKDKYDRFVLTYTLLWCHGRSRTLSNHQEGKGDLRATTNMSLEESRGLGHAGVASTCHFCLR